MKLAPLFSLKYFEKASKRLRPPPEYEREKLNKHVIIYLDFIFCNFSV